MTLLFNWTESDYVSAYWAWLVRRPWKIALAFWYSLLILGMVVVGAMRNSQNWRTQLVYVAIALGAAALGFARTRWNMHRSFKNVLLPDGLVTAGVDERGMSLSAQGVEKSYLWSDFSRVYETRSVVVLEKWANEYIFLPKSAMVDAQLDELRRQVVSAPTRQQLAMAEAPGVGVDVRSATITCLDEVPALAQLAARQRFLMKGYQPVGLAPFVVVLVISLGFFPDSNSSILAFLFVASLVWTLAVVVYTVYLWVSLRCPVCKNRFGMADNCRSCKLPRHSNSSGLFRVNS
jgi:hypothetical protein